MVTCNLAPSDDRVVGAPIRVGTTAETRRATRAPVAAHAPNLDDTLRAVIREIVGEELARANRSAASTPAVHLSTRDAAQHAGVAMGTIRRWIRDGKLREMRAGRHLRVRRADVDALLRGERAAPGASPEELARKAFGR